MWKSYFVDFIFMCTYVQGLTHKHLQNFEIPKNMSNKVAFLMMKMSKQRKIFD